VKAKKEDTPAQVGFTLSKGLSSFPVFKVDPQNVFSGVRKPVGFRCDTGLYSAFKPVAKAYFGSVCRPLF